MTDKLISDLKSRARADIKQHRSELISLGRKIHNHPETAMNEHKALGWLTAELEANGFAVETGICGMPTAFRASYGQGQPRLAFLAEYDALPGLGHGCGHNLIATAAVAAAIGARHGVDRLGGTVLVIGTPAEELMGGKIQDSYGGEGRLQ